MALISLQDVDIEFNVDAQLDRSLKRTFFQFLKMHRSIASTVRALQSVSLSIHNGERVGLIGANGAGKSTLLRVMSGIYRPRKGNVAIQGHVCPLFEFATGFEMEATGRENIQIRALLLGMSPREIKEKIEEIGQFTDLGEFLNMPVRCYSSGMLTRLAFATTTTVEPEVLLLDEVMATGDAAFMEKARNRMNALVAKASIVVFASHNLTQLPSFCDRTVWLDHGRVMFDGPTAEAIQTYEASFIKR